MKSMRRILIVCATLAIVAGSAFAQLSPEVRDWAKGPVQFIMTPQELAQWNQIKTDADAKAFTDLFWARRDPSPGTPVNEYRDAFEAAVIVCFVVAPQRRRQGISRALLTAALASFGARGLKVVDAFPFKSGASELAADHYHGSLSLFLDQGFTVLRDDETLTAVRKTLR